MWLIDDPLDALRVLVVGSLAYVLLVISVRVSGKRMLAKMNAFDLIVTVALGSTLAAVLLQRDVSLAEAAVAFALLAALQFAVAYTSVRSRSIRTLVKSEPTLLVRDGRLLEDRMRTERVTASEVMQAIRSQGVGRLDQVAAVVLETDGTFSVLTDAPAGDPVLDGLAGGEGGAG